MEKKFSWGRVIEIRDFDGEEIVVYHPWKRDGTTILTGYHDITDVLYSVQSCHESYPTFYHAVLGVIAKRQLGLNTSDLVYAMARMLNIEE